MLFDEELVNVSKFDKVIDKEYGKYYFKYIEFCPLTILFGDDITTLCLNGYYELNDASYHERDVPSAIKYFTKASNLGCLEAKMNLVILYLDKDSLNFNLNKGITYLKELLKEDYPKAYNALAYFAYKGEFVKASYEEVIKYLNKGVLLNYASSKYNLALCYLKGIGVNKDLDKAITLLKEASEQGYSKACNKLGDIYLNEEYFPDVRGRSAEHYYQLGTDLNDALSYLKLGKLYYYAYLDMPYYKKSFYCFQKAMYKGNIEANAYLGECYLYGYGTEIDIKAGLDYLNFALDNEVYEAAYILGEYYFHKNEIDSAIKYFKIAGEHHDQVALKYLIKLYYFDEYNHQDYNEAFKIASELVKYEDREIEWLFGTMYQEGKGTEVNHREALKYYILSADKDYVPACKSIYRISILEDGAINDPKLAYKYLKKAVDLDDPLASYIYGKNLFLGFRIEKDTVMGRVYLSKARRLGNAEAVKFIEKINHK